MCNIGKFKCEKCREHVYDEAPLFLFKGAWVCGDCLKDALYDMTEFEVAELLDLDTETAYSLAGDEYERSDKLWQAV